MSELSAIESENGGLVLKDTQGLMIEQQQKEIDLLKGLLKEAAGYLDINNLTSIGSGSIFHILFREAAKWKQ